MKRCCILIVFVAINSLLVKAVPLEVSERIIGGIDAPEGAYPYQISIRYAFSHSCGGSIIHPEWVLTAASCVYGIPESLLTIVAGSNSLSNGGIHYPVIATYAHERYDNKTQDNDIAVLRVKHINFNERVGAITLDYLNVPENRMVTVSGWGYTNPSHPFFPDKLQHIGVLTIGNEMCSQKLNKPVQSTQLCTFTRAGEGTCTGDAGGPLVDILSGKLIGIARAIHFPCGKGLPDVHSRVSSYYSWVRDRCNCI
ncbi:hypothetical protein ILUMI_20252 [Ignelater luminosus]|uniref:Peptidase S1 domain-containing protein n=1 Tax=Ignelater luminosus TaxID=2038154 RepID=A0A8K0CEJ2_IGNLU|nr:hypothetical protein ILUMI_20252 [Ignelater luminosus]